MRTIRRTTELRISRHCCGEVAGHFNFGNDRDVEFLGVGHDIANLVLRIEIRAVLLVGPILAVFQIGIIGIGARSSHGRQFRIFLHFDAPALVVGQVPVEEIHLVISHDAQHLLDFLDREEVAAHVEHETAIGEARRVVDGNAGNRVGRAGIEFLDEHVARQHFLDTLQTVEKAFHGAGLQRDSVFGDHEDVTFFVERRSVHLQLDGGIFSVADRHATACGSAECGGEVVGLGHNVVRQFADIDCDGLRKDKLSRLRRHGFRPRRKVYRLRRCLQRQAQQKQQNCLDFYDFLHDNYPVFFDKFLKDFH